jgi:hypothetical protein
MGKRVSIDKFNLKSILQMNFLLKKMTIPIILLAFYSGLFSNIYSYFLPYGVNSFFALTLCLISLLFALILYVILIILYFFKKSEGLVFNNKNIQLSISKIFLILIPLTPIMQYIINNKETLSLLDSMIVFIFFTFFSAIFIYVIPLFLGKYSSTRILMSLGLSFVFIIVSMATLSKTFFWFQEGDLKIQFGFLTIVLIVTWLLLGLKDKWVIYMITSVFFVTNSIFQLITCDHQIKEESFSDSDHRLELMMIEKKPKSTPNVYLLIYDAYVANETLIQYGIDNMNQEKFLIKQGFIIYPHTYSIGAYTLPTMSRVLDIANEIEGPYQRVTSGDGTVQNLFHNLGYETYGLFPTDYQFRTIDSSYDNYLPESKAYPVYWYLITSILSGEFRFNVGFEEQSYNQYIEEKQKIFQKIYHRKVFVYSHSNMPSHSQNSGACLENEIELYKERLEVANLEIKNDVQLLVKNDPEAIIIIAGDHGPYLTKNCSTTEGAYDISSISRLDIQDRYGTFLAIRWPTEEYKVYDDIIVLQDIFPVIFAYLFADESFLTLRVVPESIDDYTISGATIKKGVIQGGIDDGEPLFISKD